MDIYEIAGLIREKRRDKGWTQGELARRAGVSRQLVAEFENERLDEIGFKKMGRMCMALKLEIQVESVGVRFSMEEDATARRVAELDHSDRVIAEAMTSPSRRSIRP